MRIAFKMIEAAREAEVSPEFEASRKRTTLEPERELMLAVLEDAVACYQRHLLATSGAGKILFREAEEWISNRRNNWEFSFESICETLGLSANYIRKGLLQFKQRALDGRPRAKIYSLPRAENRSDFTAHAGPVCAECEHKKRRFG